MDLIVIIALVVCGGSFAIYHIVLYTRVLALGEKSGTHFSVSLKNAIYWLDKHQHKTDTATAQLAIHTLRNTIIISVFVGGVAFQVGFQVVNNYNQIDNRNQLMQVRAAFLGAAFFSSFVCWVCSIRYASHLGFMMGTLTYLVGVERKLDIAREKREIWEQHKQHDDETQECQRHLQHQRHQERQVHEQEQEQSPKRTFSRHSHHGIEFRYDSAKEEENDDDKNKGDMYWPAEAPSARINKLDSTIGDVSTSMKYRRTPSGQSSVGDAAIPWHGSKPARSGRGISFTAPVVAVAGTGVGATDGVTDGATHNSTSSEAIASGQHYVPAGPTWASQSSGDLSTIITHIPPPLIASTAALAATSPEKEIGAGGGGPANTAGASGPGAESDPDSELSIDEISSECKKMLYRLLIFMR